MLVYSFISFYIFAMKFLFGTILFALLERQIYRRGRNRMILHPPIHFPSSYNGRSWSQENLPGLPAAAGSQGPAHHPLLSQATSWTARARPELLTKRVHVSHTCTMSAVLVLCVELWANGHCRSARWPRSGDPPTHTGDLQGVLQDWTNRWFSATLSNNI